MASSRGEHVTIGDIPEDEQLPQSLTREILTIKEHISSLRNKWDDLCDALIPADAAVASGELYKLRQIEKDARKLAASISDMRERAENVPGTPDMTSHKYMHGQVSKCVCFY